MSWKEVTLVDERKRFIDLAQCEESPGVAALCRDFGISRKTAYKWIGRYEELGEAGLLNLSRAPHSHPNAVSQALEDLIISAREAHPSWGAKKLLPWLQRKHPRRQQWPCVATISAILDRNQLVRSRKKRRPVAAYVGSLTQPVEANDLWCIDHKGWWLARNGDKCEPFTVTDEQTRYLLRCALCVGKGIQYVRPVLIAAFQEYGLPLVIRSDNGAPFASRAPLGLSELSVWLIRLGICHERIEVGKPQQNACHERMHLTMLKDRGEPIGASLREEQKRLNAWRAEFNHERPHEALGFDTPAVRYRPSPRAMPHKVPEFEYESKLVVRKVDCSGKFSWRGRNINITEALCGIRVGFEASAEDGIWSMWLGQMHVGSFNEKTSRLTWAQQMTRRSTG